MQPVAEIALPGRPRWVLYDPESDVVFANIREPAEIVLIDCDTGGVVGSLQVPAAGPHGLWLDQGRLFCAADEGALVVLDRDSGDVRASLPLPGPPDVLMLDSAVARAYVAIGDPGVVCSVDTRLLEVVETVPTERGAHTLGWDPDRRSLYVFCPGSGGAVVLEERF